MVSQCGSATGWLLEDRPGRDDVRTQRSSLLWDNSHQLVTTRPGWNTLVEGRRGEGGRPARAPRPGVTGEQYRHGSPGAMALEAV
jgi:hypothetical protein